MEQICMTRQRDKEPEDAPEQMYLISESELCDIESAKWSGVGVAVRSRKYEPDKEARCCFGKYDDCPCEDECVIRVYCEKYAEAVRMQANISWAVNEEHDAAIRKETIESENVKTLVGNAFKAGEAKGAKDEREKVLKELANEIDRVSKTWHHACALHEIVNSIRGGE